MSPRMSKGGAGRRCRMRRRNDTGKKHRKKAQERTQEREIE